MALPTRPDSGLDESRLEFETLISDTSASLFAAPPDDLDPVIEGALDRVREFFQVDRCALLSVSEDHQVANVRLGSYAEGVEPVSEDVNLAEVFPWSAHRLLVERRAVRVSGIDELPPEADQEREAWRRLPIRSALSLPLEIRGRINHVIILNTVHRECEWPDTFVARLRVLGELLAGALERGWMFAELSRTEARLSMAAESAGAGLWALDYATGAVWVTDRARRIFGFAPDEDVTMDRVKTVVHAEDWGRVREVIERSASERGPVSADYRIRRPDDGQTRWIASRGQPWFTATGEPDRLMGLSIDITDQKLVEQELRASKLRLASGVDLASLAFFEVNYRDGTTFADDRFRELCGFGPGHEHSFHAVKFWMEHLHPDDRPRIVKGREQLHDGRIARFALEYRYLHPEHGLRWFHHLARVGERDASGAVVRTYGVLRDITSRKQAEEDRRELSRRLIRAQEEERALLARELHDDLTQRLAVLAIDVDRARPPAPQGALAETMRHIHEQLVRLSEDIHALAYQLHPSILEELGLADALRAECEQRSRQNGLRIAAELDPGEVVIEKDAALCLFRVAQEALKNVSRHAAAKNVRLSLRPADQGLLLAVADDGVGFDVGSPGKQPHLGHLSMMERVQLVNGTLDIESEPGHGTAVIAWVPEMGHAT